MRTRRCAFSLVELLVVVGILVLLMSILIPVLNLARRSSLGVTCASNLRQIGMACIGYQEQWSGRLPNNSYTLGDNPANLNPAPPAGTSGAAYAQQRGYLSTSAREWFDAVAPFFGWEGHSTVAARCGANEQDLFRRQTQYLWCPQVDQSQYDPGVFATNYGICRDISRGYNLQATPAILPGTSLDFLTYGNIRNPSDVVFLTESRLWNAQADAYDLTNDSIANTASYNGGSTRPIIHHNGVNYLFFDGHVSEGAAPPHSMGGETGLFRTVDGSAYNISLAEDVAFRSSL